MLPVNPFPPLIFPFDPPFSPEMSCGALFSWEVWGAVSFFYFFLFSLSPFSPILRASQCPLIPPPLQLGFRFFPLSPPPPSTFLLPCFFCEVKIWRLLARCFGVLGAGTLSLVAGFISPIIPGFPALGSPFSLVRTFFVFPLLSRPLFLFGSPSPLCQLFPSQWL